MQGCIAGSFAPSPCDDSGEVPHLKLRPSPLESRRVRVSSSLLLWGAEVPADIHEERLLLRSRLVSNYAEFKAIILGDMLKSIPAGKSLDDLIEEFLRAKYGDHYEPPT